MKIIINSFLFSAMGFLLATLGARLTSWQFWVAMFICFALTVISSLDL